MSSLEMRFLGNFSALGSCSFLLLSDRNGIQNCIFSKGAKDSEKMILECGSFFSYNQLVSVSVLSYSIL